MQITARYSYGKHPTVGGSGFKCTDPNKYWMGDYQCSCAYAAPVAGQTKSSYDQPTVTGCGTERIISSSSKNVTNFELDRYLSMAPVTRAHVCRLVGNPTDCI